MNLVEARDAIQGAFRTAWVAGSTAVAGYVPTVFYEGVGKPDDPTVTQHWVEVFVRHITGTQITLANASGLRRFEKTGLVTVSVFSPVVVAHGLQQGAELAQVALGAFQGKAAGNLWFKNARISEAGMDGSWYSWNIISTFSWEEFA